MKTAIALLALLGSQLASANSVLTYTGQAFNDGAAGAGSVTATIEFSKPLVAGITLTAADIVSFSISALGNTVTSSSAYTYSDFTFQLGADALPNVWRMAVEMNVTGDSSKPEQWTSNFGMNWNWNLDAFSIDDAYAKDSYASGASYSDIWASGHWAASSSVSAVPEPSSWALMGFGGAALFIARRRTNKA